MATQTFTLEGQSYTVPHGTSMDELDEYIKGQKKGPSPEVAAAANPPKAPPGPPMKQWSATGPDVTPITQKQSDTAHTGAPSGVLGGMAGLAPVGIAEKGFAGYVAPLARGALKSYAGSEIGKYMGRGVGSMFGEKGAETGGQIGQTAGALAGPFVGGKSFAKLPFGVGRMVASNEEYAAANAERKVAQRAADVKAGLRKAPGGYPGVESASPASGTPRTGHSVILPNEEIDPLRVQSAGSAAQATEEDLRRLASFGDRSAKLELIRRRLPLGQEGTMDYSKFPMPRGR